MLKTAIFSVLLLLSLGINAHEVKCEYNEKSDNSPYIWISLGSDAIAELQKTFPTNKIVTNKSNDGITLIQVREGQVLKIDTTRQKQVLILNHGLSLIGKN